MFLFSKGKQVDIDYHLQVLVIINWLSYDRNTLKKTKVRTGLSPNDLIPREPFMRNQELCRNSFLSHVAYLQ
jgi:hypothetical protein